MSGEAGTVTCDVCGLPDLITEIDPDKLDLLADWLDMDDARKGGGRGAEVQADLRRWARLLREHAGLDKS